MGSKIISTRLLGTVEYVLTTDDQFSLYERMKNQSTKDPKDPEYEGWSHLIMYSPLRHAFL